MYRLTKIFIMCICFGFVVVILSNQASSITLSFNPSNSSICSGDLLNMDITISDLGSDNLAEFSFNINYDDTILNFDSYILGNELGEISYGDADDWSLGDLGGGTINLAEISWLWDLSAQPDSFTLASVAFYGNSVGNSILTFSDVILGDEWGDSLPAILDCASVNVVPEPSTIILLCFGLAGFLGLKKKWINYQ